MVWRNQTFNFIPLGIFDHSSTHIFFFSLVLGIFTVAFMGNTVMVLLIYLDTQLHTPMYFLLIQLSLMSLICTTVPKMASNYLSGSKSISLASCGAQVFFYVSLLRAECFLLAVLVCHPLQYTILMNQKLCVLLTVASWTLGYVDGVTVLVAALPYSYCHSLEVHHFFCDITALLPLSCTDTFAFERLLFICCVLMLIIPVSVIIGSFSRVLEAVIHISSVESHCKAFTTCSSHLFVVGLYYSAAMFMYVGSPSDHTPDQDKIVPSFYTILIPMLNPFIYSLHNKEVSRELHKLLRKKKVNPTSVIAAALVGPRVRTWTASRTTSVGSALSSHLRVHAGIRGSLLRSPVLTLLLRACPYPKQLPPALRCGLNDPQGPSQPQASLRTCPAPHSCQATYAFAGRLACAPTLPLR
ncbi:LOW QUALITY PROTEIN: olfactory receptor 2M4-like [Rhynchonycteris naso]